MDLDFWAVIAGILVGLFFGFAVFVLFIRYKISQISGNLDNLIREAIQEVEKDMIGVNVEKHNGIFYAYRENDNQFVAQGNTVEELRTAFKTAFPNKITYLAGGDKEVIAEITEALEATIK